MADLHPRDFLDDFFQEVEELRPRIHHGLLRLEDLLRDPARSDAEFAGQVTELLRAFHTIKGLVGMVGLEPASRLAHALETSLQHVQRGLHSLEPGDLDVLFEGERALEQWIATLRDPKQVGPDIETLVDSLNDPTTRDPVARPGSGATAEATAAGTVSSRAQALLRTYPEISAHLGPLEWDQIHQSLQARRHFALAFFQPTAEKAAAGQSVNQVRERIQSLGALIKAVPMVEGASIRFAFLFAADALPEPGALPNVQVTPLELPAAASPQSSARAAPGEQVRVDLDRVEELVRQVSDLMTARNHLSDLLPSLEGAPVPALREMRQRIGRLDRSLRDLRRSVLRIRMVPLGEVFNHLPLAVRDLARSTGKEVHLITEGAETEVDKAMVDRLLDPLLHLVRNAVSHGLETPAERTAAGKPAHGTLTLRGGQEGELIRIEVSDDGRGIDLARIGEEAARRGWIPANEALSEAEALQILTRPGFSTRSSADLSAGRGIGLDVVQRAVSALGGSLRLRTTPGAGATFILRLPLTLVVMSAILVHCGSERYAVPKAAVEEIIEIDPGQIARLDQQELIPYRESSAVLFRLGALFGSPGDAARPARYGLVHTVGDQRTVFAVDRLLGQRELVVRPVQDPLVVAPGIRGASEQADGSVILIVDLEELLQTRRLPAAAAGLPVEERA